jgi:hypothetical protein
MLFKVWTRRAQRIKSLESELARERDRHQWEVDQFLRLIESAADKRQEIIALGAEVVQELSMQRSALARSIDEVVVPALRDCEEQYGHSSRTRRAMEKVLEHFFCPVIGEDLQPLHGPEIEDVEGLIDEFREFLDDVSPDDFAQGDS